MKKIRLISLLFTIFLFGCSEYNQSFYGTYSNYSETKSEWKEVELTKPNFFTYKTIRQRGDQRSQRTVGQGKFEEQTERLFLVTDAENNRGYFVYLIDGAYDSIQIGTSEWRETLYRVDR
jgi:hypothetical protein